LRRDIPEGRPSRPWREVLVAAARQRDARAVTRFLFSSAFELERDSQGRVVLPAAIRDWAGLGSEAVIVGAGDRVDIWSPEVWASKSLSPEGADQPALRPGL
jgi:division/cell wall cluster transcriptional repressor MraZ